MMLTESELRFFTLMEALLDSVPARTDHSYKMALLDSLLAYSGASSSHYVSRRVCEIVDLNINKVES